VTFPQNALWKAIVSDVPSDVARLGVTDLSPFPDVQQEIDRRKDSGERGSLGFTYKDPATACAPSRSFPWGRSIVVAAVPYLGQGDGPIEDAPLGTGRPVARFADGDRYRDVAVVLDRIATVLSEAGWRTEAVFDDDRLVDRAVAVRAGVGWWGKSTMAITPGFGPWFLIGSIVTDATLPLTAPMSRGCGTCDACIPACPTGAIVAPGVLDARRCLAAIFQGRGSIDRDLREAAGTRVYGCDECLVACPPGRPALGILEATATIHPRDILTMGDAEIDGMFRHWYIPGRKARFVRRNALVATGNGGHVADVALVAPWLETEDAMVREHAAWALGRLGGEDATTLLRDAAAREADDVVAAEIAAALQS
jgi:epoxyqueuosine reductase